MLLHIPVLLNEVLAALNASKGGLFIDGTFGAGGYSSALLRACSQNQVIAFDRDPNVLSGVEELQTRYSGRLTFFNDCFGNMAQYVHDLVDGIVLDLGISSMQIDRPERGFSFRYDGPLDMRMSCQGVSARDVVNTFPEKKIADILFKYGEERAAYRIARKIVQYRSKKLFETTLELAEVIHLTMPKPKDGSDSAMRSFQALRIFVNDELGELERALDAAIKLLKPGGRLVVVSFHSLEDRIVKNFMVRHSVAHPATNRYLPEPISMQPVFQIITKKPVQPTQDELIKNPRAHSAKLRYAQKLDDFS